MVVLIIRSIRKCTHNIVANSLKFWYLSENTPADCWHEQNKRGGGSHELVHNHI